VRKVSCARARAAAAVPAHRRSPPTSSVPAPLPHAARCRKPSEPLPHMRRVLPTTLRRPALPRFAPVATVLACALRRRCGSSFATMAAPHIITAAKGADADHVQIKTALLSVSDKTGLVDLGKALAARGVKASDANCARARAQDTAPAGWTPCAPCRRVTRGRWLRQVATSTICAAPCGRLRAITRSRRARARSGQACDPPAHTLTAVLAPPLLPHPRAAAAVHGRHRQGAA
jgi:hypothetical protein